MSELTLTVLQLGFVVLLWVFVLSVVGVLRHDLFGTKVVTRRSSGGRATARTPARAPQQAPPPPAGRSAPSSLVVTAGSLAGTTLDLGQAPVLIGRGPDCTLVLSDEYASTRHARLFPQDGRWWVEDLGSTNGTRLGRERLRDPRPIEPGEQLRIGQTVLELRR